MSNAPRPERQLRDHLLAIRRSAWTQRDDLMAIVRLVEDAEVSLSYSDLDGSAARLSQVRQRWQAVLDQDLGTRIENAEQLIGQIKQSGPQEKEKDGEHG